MPLPTDTELVERHRQGDVVAFNILITRYTSPLYRFILRLSGEPAVAEDLVQETCVKAWRKLSSFQADRSFKSWIFTIARNTTFDYLKKKKAIPFSALDEQSPIEESFQDRIEDIRPLPPELIERADRAQIIEQALQTLPARTRTILLLHEGEDLTFQEIAETVKEPLNTVKSRYRRALITLRTTVERLLGGSAPKNGPSS